MKWCLQGFSHVLYVGWACPRNLILLVEKGYAFSLLKIGIWAPTFYCQAKSFHSNSAEEIMDILDCYLNYIVQQSQFLFSAWLSCSLYDYSVCFSRMVCSLWLFWVMLSLIWFLQFGYRHTEFLMQNISLFLKSEEALMKFCKGSSYWWVKGSSFSKVNNWWERSLAAHRTIV
jgi:hypothetical protein